MKLPTPAESPRILSASSPLERLRGGRGAGAPLVTWILTAAMLIVSVPTVIFPALNGVFGGVGYRAYPWQVFSSAFQHGWPGFPLLLHLILDLVILQFTAPIVERMLGAARFLGLTLLSILCYWIARMLTGLDANGSSVFIWSYAPMLFLALTLARSRGWRKGAATEEFRFTLTIMWVFVTLAMAVFLFLGGVDPLRALLYGNAFHISATVAGFAGAAVWRGHVLRRIESEDFGRGPADRAAVGAALCIPLFFLLVLVLWLLGLVKP